jgi:hypothetical protein
VEGERIGGQGEIDDLALSGSQRHSLEALEFRRVEYGLGDGAACCVCPKAAAKAISSQRRVVKRVRRDTRQMSAYKWLWTHRDFQNGANDCRDTNKPCSLPYQSRRALKAQTGCDSTGTSHWSRRLCPDSSSR